MRTGVLIFAVALFARVAAAAFFGISGPAIEDERGYALIANSLVDGHGFALTLPPELGDALPRTSFRAPLWPSLLAVVAWLGGGLAAFRVVAMVLGAMAPVAFYAALRRTSAREFAHWPALALALWPPAIYTSIRLLSEPLAALLMLVALLLANPENGTEEPPTTAKRPAWMGLVLGLAVLARPAAIVPSACLAVTRRSWRAIAVCAGVALLDLAPWLIRNAALHGRVLLTTNSGVTLVGSNSAAALDAEHPGKWAAPEAVYGGQVDPPDLGMWGWHALSEAQSDARFAADARRFVVDHPADALQLVGWKCVRFLDPDTHSMKDDGPLKRVIGWVTWLPAVLLGALGYLAHRRAQRATDDRSLTPYLALFCGVLATSLIFYADARMRSAADPAVLLFAVIGVRSLLARVAGSPRVG